MNQKGYTLIMGVKNAETYIGETLQSVVSQTLLPDRIIVMDDASQDQTIEIIKSFSFDIEIIKNKKPGLASGFNQAIQLVNSQYLAFLDSDDLWLASKQEKQISFLNKNKNFDVVSSAVLNFKKREINDQNFESSRAFPPSRLFTASTFCSSVFDKYGFLDESVGHFGWLFDWWSMAGAAGIQCGQINEVLLHRRIHETNSWILQRELGTKTLIELARRNISRAK